MEILQPGILPLSSPFKPSHTIKDEILGRYFERFFKYWDAILFEERNRPNVSGAFALLTTKCAGKIFPFEVCTPATWFSLVIICSTDFPSMTSPLFSLMISARALLKSCDRALIYEQGFDWKPAGMNA